MEKEERFLPVGTVVLLKGGKKELVIVSYCIIPSGNVQEVVYDYGGCLYPEGLIRSDQLYAFNHDQIEKVIFKGYESSEQSNLSNVIKELINDKKRDNLIEEIKTRPIDSTIEPVNDVEEPSVEETTNEPFDMNQSDDYEKDIIEDDDDGTEVL